MIRFIRSIIYGAVAAIVATLFLDWLDGTRTAESRPPRVKASRPSGNDIDQMSEDAKKALLDELAAQV